jgi:hypothetical protein
MSERHLTTLALGPVLALALGTSACATRYIPNTDVEDNDENREIVAFCEKYRKAVERKDVVVLLSMASPEYYEDGGNADASDDIDYAGLKDYLAAKFQDAKGIRYEIRYRRVTPEEKAILIEYTYSASFKIPGPSGDSWQRQVQDNRLELVPKDDGFLIVGGM